MDPVTALPPLERELTERVAVVSQASGAPHATASSVAEAVLRDKSATRTSFAPAENLPGAEGGAVAVDGSALETALVKQPFRDVADALVGTDLTTAMGKVEAIAAGFNGCSVISIRALLSDKPIPTRNETIAKLIDLRGHLADYFTWILVSDDAGDIPPRLKRYSFVGAPLADGAVSKEGLEFLTLLRACQLVSMDWMNSPGGVLAHKAVLDGTNSRLRVHFLDVYTIPEHVELLGKFIHSVLVAMGTADTPPGGMDNALTWQQWNDLYLNHLKRATSFPTLELQYNHLDHCFMLYTTALRVAGRRLAEAIFSRLPADKRIDTGLLPMDEPPVTVLTQRETARQQVADLRFNFDGCIPGLEQKASSSASAQFPLRSNNPLLRGQKSARDADVSKATDDSKRFRSNKQLVTPRDASPGAAEASFLWLAYGMLYISGYVWNTVALAKKLRVSPKIKCWPYLLTRKRNKQSVCKSWGKVGHENDTSACHVIKDFNIDDHAKDLTVCRPPTEAERKKLAVVQANPPAMPALDARGRARGKGQRGRWQRGRARGGEHFGQSSE